MFLILLIQSALAGSVCVDGWVSKSSGKGTCSHHGGISGGMVPVAVPTHVPAAADFPRTITKDGLDLSHCAMQGFGYSGQQRSMTCDGFLISVTSGEPPGEYPFSPLSSFCKESNFTNLRGAATFVCSPNHRDSGSYFTWSIRIDKVIEVETTVKRQPGMTVPADVFVGPGVGWYRVSDPSVRVALESRGCLILSPAEVTSEATCPEESVEEKVKINAETVTVARRSGLKDQRRKEWTTHLRPSLFDVGMPNFAMQQSGWVTHRRSSMPVSSPK